MAARVALVTGGGRGIGRAVVDRLLADGFTVVTGGRGGRPADLPDAVTWVRGDVSVVDDAERLVASAVGLGDLVAVVNNAGVVVERTVADSTDADWDAVVGTNCRGVFQVSRAALAAFTGPASIVNVGSISGDVADASMALYNASKAFVHGLTRSIAVDHGPAVRCNAVSPGWVGTDMSESGFALAVDPAAAEADALARTPAGRLGTPADVANAVAWLVSDQAAFVTGQCLTVDGGLTAASPLRPGLL